jgi:uncharacterized protein YjiS (DUF1127 family)
MGRLKAGGTFINRGGGTQIRLCPLHIGRSSKPAISRRMCGATQPTSLIFHFISMHLVISCIAAIHFALQRNVPISFNKFRQMPGKGHQMLTSFIRFVQNWRQYGETVRELSNLNDRELADLGITRSDIPHVAWENTHR